MKKEKAYGFGDKISFSHLSVIAGKELALVGTIIGNATDVKAFWPEEMDGLKGTEKVYLVRVEDKYFGNVHHHAVWADEILKKEV